MPAWSVLVEDDTYVEGLKSVEEILFIRNPRPRENPKRRSLKGGPYKVTFIVAALD